MSWASYRPGWTTLAAAVRNAPDWEGWGERLQKHPVVTAALTQIELAERAIQSVADQLNCEYHDEPEEVGDE